MIPCKHIVGSVSGQMVYVEAALITGTGSVESWKVMWLDSAVGSDLVACWEPRPSERSAEFLLLCRFPKFHEAFEVAVGFIAKEGGTVFVTGKETTLSDDLKSLSDRLDSLENKAAVFENQIDRIIQDFEAALDKLRALNKSC